jgi:AcrR family transcriptional regulator
VRTVAGGYQASNPVKTAALEKVMAVRSRGRPRNQSLLERRRKEILEVAARYFAQHGYSQTDVQIIADALGVGKGTIYRYFPTKEALFLATVDQGVQALKQAVDEAAAKARTPIQRIEFGIRGYLTYFDSHPEVIELLIQERTHFRDRPKPTYFVHKEEHLRPWKELLRQLIATGVIREVPVERIVDVLSDLLYGTIFTNYFAKRRKSLAKQCEDVIDIVFHGLLRCHHERR